MATTPKTHKKAKGLQTKLTITGVLLTFGWALVLAAINWPMNLPCVISPNDCMEGEGLAYFILFVPIFAGSILTPISLVYDQKLSRLIKFFIVLVLAFIMYYAAYYLVFFLGISFYGF